MGTGHRDNSSSNAAVPGSQAAMIEDNRQLACEGHASGHALHAAYEARRILGPRKAISHLNNTAGGLKSRFEHKGIAEIPTFHVLHGLDGSNAPTAVGCVAKQRGKNRTGLERGPTQPVDRAVFRDKRGRLPVAKQSVVFYACGHD